MINREYFTDIGRDIKSGVYKNLLRGTSEYITLWDTIIDRCYNGYTVGGVYITPELWSYVNFGSILLADDEGQGKNVGLPKLRDVDWEIDYYFHEADRLKKGLNLVGGRRLGKTNLITWHASVYPITFLNQWVAVGTFAEKQMNDYMAQVYRHISGLSGTELKPPLLKSSIDGDLELGYSIRNKDTNQFENILTGGKLSSRLFRNNPTAGNGISSFRFVFEEIGMFDNYKEALTNSEPCWKEGTKYFGMPVGLGTGGDMKKGSVQAAEVFEDPDSYNFLSFVDPDNPKKKICYFIDGYKSFNDLRDKNGVVDKAKGIEYIDSVREERRKGKTLTALMQFIQYYPKNWREAFLRSSGNLFKDAMPLMQIQLDYLMVNNVEDSMVKGYFKTNPNSPEIVIVNGKGVFEPSSLAKEVPFPVRDSDDKEGCIIIYEFPQKINGEVPANLYASGTDPYNEDVATSSPSLGSIFIYKRFNTLGGTSKVLVAEYTGRPLTDAHFYQQAMGLLLMYNAQTLYENQGKGMRVHFAKYNQLKLLKRQPSHIKDFIENSTVNRIYGIHMTIQIKLYIIKLIKNYLLEKLDEDRFFTETVMFKWLLVELMSANMDENFDRLMAFGLTLLCDESMARIDTDAIHNNEEATDFFKTSWDKVFTEQQSDYAFLKDF